MKRYYITGTQGTGKTTIARELQRRGFFVADTDTFPDLCYWRNKATGHKVSGKTGDRKQWLEAHEWYCDPTKLKQLLDEHAHEVVFIAGISENQLEYLDLFDKIFLLQCREQTFLRRIDERTDHHFGKDQAEREKILSLYKNFENTLLLRGAICIHTENPIEVVAENIIESM